MSGHDELMASLNTLLSKVTSQESRLLALEGDLGTVSTNAKTGSDNTLEIEHVILVISGILAILHVFAGFILRETTSLDTKLAQVVPWQKLKVGLAAFLTFTSFTWGFAYGAGGKFVSHGFFLDGFQASLFKQVNFWMYQSAYSILTCFLMGSAMAGRTQLKSLLISAVLLVGWIYPVVLHWGISGKGWLNYTEHGKIESSVNSNKAILVASSLAHLVGGVAGLCGSIIVGPRQGRFAANPQPVKGDIMGDMKHIMSSVILWIFWFVFHSSGEQADSAMALKTGLVIINMVVAPVVCGVTVAALRSIKSKAAKQTEKDPNGGLDEASGKASPVYVAKGFFNGILVGLVAITACCYSVNPWEAILIGLIAAPIYHGVSKLLEKLKVDDPADVFAVSGASSIWGVLALGFFGKQGLFRSGEGRQLATQIVATLTIVAWIVFFTVLGLLPLRYFGLLREGPADVEGDAVNTPVGNAAYVIEENVIEEQKANVQEKNSADLEVADEGPHHAGEDHKSSA